MELAAAWLRGPAAVLGWRDHDRVVTAAGRMHSRRPPPGQALCFYRPSDPGFPYATRTKEVVWRDPSRLDHIVPVQIRYPLGAIGPRPVVIWHHGGETRRFNPLNGGNFGSNEHSELFARAGYVAIQIVRVDSDLNPYTDPKQCTQNGGRGGLDVCRTWKGYHVDGPLNTPFVVERLANALPPLPGFEGTLDLAQVVGGHEGRQRLHGTARVLLGAAHAAAHQAPRRKQSRRSRRRSPRDRKSTRLNSSHVSESRMPSSA